MQPNLKRGIAHLAVLVAAVVLLAACGSSSKSKAGSTTSTAGGVSTSTETPTTAAAAGPVSTTSNPKLGQILVDAKGMTVYVFDSDQGTKSACVSACANAWPAVVLDAGASLPTSGALSADLTTAARPDGAQQVAYKGRLLYRFAGDGKAGDTNGDGSGGIWHAVKLSQSSGGGATTTTAARVSPY